MSSCHKNDSEAKVLVAECLGELGAVDPGRSVFLSILSMRLYHNHGIVLQLKLALQTVLQDLSPLHSPARLIG